MAVDPKASIQSVSYEGGVATATLGLLEKLFGEQRLSWTQPSRGTFQRDGTQRQRIIGGASVPVLGSNPRRKSWVGKMASNNATGLVAIVYFKDGTNWQVRYSGPFTDLVKAVSNGTASADVVQIMSERGAKSNKGITLPGPA